MLGLRTLVGTGSHSNAFFSGGFFSGDLLQLCFMTIWLTYTDGCRAIAMLIIQLDENQTALKPLKELKSFFMGISEPG